MASIERCWMIITLHSPPSFQKLEEGDLGLTPTALLTHCQSQGGTGSQGVGVLLVV
jgi:hypothetical protein